MKNNKLLRMMNEYVCDKRFSIIYKNNKLNIINYSEIIDFSSKIISIRYNNDKYYIEGDNLVISRMLENEILITGNIYKINFIK